MRKIIFALVVALFLATPAIAQSYLEDEKIEVFNIYTDKNHRNNHYAPSGWMGDYGDIKLNEGSLENPHSGATCLEITYTGEKLQNAGWMGIYWQNPPNNWGDQMGGYDLTGYKKLSFWARGKNGGEVISEFKVGGISGTYSDSDSVTVGPVTLTRDWKKYKINFEGTDLSYISGGFAMAAALRDNPNGFTIYLDDIKFEK